MASTVFTAKTRKVAILAADGIDHDSVETIRQAIEGAGARPFVVAKTFLPVVAAGGQEIDVDKSHVTTASVEYDALVVPDGADGVEVLVGQGDAVQFVQEAFKHAKAIVALGAGIDLLRRAGLDEVYVAGDGVNELAGVVTSSGGDTHAEASDRFIEAVAAHRHWDREHDHLPA